MDKVRASTDLTVGGPRTIGLGPLGSGRERRGQRVWFWFDNEQGMAHAHAAVVARQPVSPAATVRDSKTRASLESTHVASLLPSLPDIPLVGTVALEIVLAG